MRRQGGEQSWALKVLQRWFRTQLALQETRRRRAEYRRKYDALQRRDRQRWAALTIQCAWRGYAVRQALTDIRYRQRMHNLRTEEARLAFAAITITKWWRGMMGRQVHRRLKEVAFCSVPQGCVRRGGTAEAVRQAVGGGCQSGWGRLLSVASAVEAGASRQGDCGWA